MIVEHRKRDARVLSIREIEKAVDDRHDIARPERANRPSLRDLVDKEHTAGDGEIGYFPENTSVQNLISLVDVAATCIIDGMPQLQIFTANIVVETLCKRGCEIANFDQLLHVSQIFQSVGSGHSRA